MKRWRGVEDKDCVGVAGRGSRGAAQPRCSPGRVVAMPRGTHVRLCALCAGVRHAVMPAAAWSHISTELQRCHPSVLAGTAEAQKGPVQKNLKHLGNACDKQRSPPREQPAPSQASCCISALPGEAAAGNPGLGRWQQCRWVRGVCGVRGSLSREHPAGTLCPAPRAAPVPGTATSSGHQP